MYKGPKILHWDIETGFLQAALFSLWHSGKMLPHDAIIEESYIMCAAFMWDHEKKVTSMSLMDYPAWGDGDFTDDSALVWDMAERVKEADALVHHNGDVFDWKWLNARCVYHGFDPLPFNVVKLDTLKMAHRAFRFNSNRLDYIARFLGLGQKIQTDRDLWLDCLRGDEKAMKKMIRYNKHDVKLLKAIYRKLAPYVPSKLNYNLWSKEIVCPCCGDSYVHKKGIRATTVALYQRWVCMVCGHSFQSRKSDPDTRVTVK